MDAAIQSAINDSRLAGAVVLATDLSGNIKIEKTYGVKTLRNASGTNPPLTADTPMRMASCTKLITAILALQAYERGQLKLDDVVGDRLPEIAAMKVLTGYDEADAPVFEEPRAKITLTHLITHAFGGAYVFFSPHLIRYATSTGQPLDASGSTIAANFDVPLVAHPGEGWQYGSGCDWAGKYVEAVTGKSFEELLQAGVCRPLGVDITFKLQSRTDMLARRADIAKRDSKTGKARFTNKDYWYKDPEDCMGGQGAFMSPASFFAILTSILRNDGKLLKPATRDMLFEDALSPASKQRLKDVATELADWKPHGPVDPDTQKSFALGGLLFQGNSADGRRKGSISWSGVTNQFWAIDPAAGLAWLTSFHFEPWGDDLCFELCRKFERSVYAKL